MAELEELTQALKKAHNANRPEDAQRIAQMIKDKQRADVSFGEYATQVLEGASFGYGDEILGSLYGAYNSIADGKPLNEAVNEGIDAMRAMQKSGEEKLGTAKALGLQAAGGIGTMFIPGVGQIGLGLRGLQGMGKGASTLGKLGQSAKVGGTTGAITGVGMAEGDFTAGGIYDRAMGGLTGGLTGAALSPALTGIAGAGRSGIDYLGRLVPGGTERQVEKLARSVVSPKQTAVMQTDMAKMPSVGVLGDVAPRDARRLLGESMRRIGGGELADQIEARQQQAYERIIPKIDEIVSDKPYFEVVKDIGAKRASTAKANYGNAYDSVLEETQGIKSVINNPAMKDIYEDAKEISKIMDTNFPENWENAKLLPTVELMDFMKQALDDRVSRAFNAGDNKRAGALITLRDKLKKEVDDQVPDYAKARSEYAGYSAALEAADQGKKFARAATDETATEDFGSILKDMGTHELDAFRAGAASVLRDKVRGKATWTDVVSGGDPTQPFKSILFKDKLEKMIGKKGTDTFLKGVGGIESEMKMSRLAMELKGSQTGQRNVAGQAMDSPMQLAVDSVGAKVGEPGSMMRTLGRVTDAINAPSSAVARGYGNLFLSNNPVDRANAVNMLMRPQTKLEQLSPAFRGGLSVGGGYLAGSGQNPISSYLLGTGQ